MHEVWSALFAPAETGVLSPSSELGVEMELGLLFCFKVV
jgi:hypothetical protein